MSFFWSRFLSVPRDREGFMSPPVYFACLPELETEDLRLRRPRLKDAGDIYDYARDAEVARYVLWDQHRSVSESRSYIRELLRRSREGYPTSWVAELRVSGQVIGTIGFMWYSAENRSAEIGYSFARKTWNHGYATQALSAVISSAFRSLPLNRIEAQHDLRNPASGRVMEKCGLRQEGILRGRVLNKGEYADVAIWAILRSDWEAAQR